MTRLPENVERYLLDTLTAEVRHAWVVSDAEGRTCETGGDLAWFGIEDVRVGVAVAERFDFLQGTRAFDSGESELLPRLELIDGRSTDVHIVRQDGGAFLLFMDATREAEFERHLQQKGNELSLILRAWGVAIFEKCGSGSFRLLGLAPAWMHALCGDARDLDSLSERFPFLENFLVDAESAWDGESRRVLWSGMWVEEDTRKREWSLEAGATRLEDGRRILIVQSAGRHYGARQRILQEARTRTLDLHRLRSEIDKKEALLHCIIHDLKGPLSGMVGSMSLIKSRDLDADRTRELLQLGLEQARYQESMIGTILEAFSADVESLESFETDAATAPDLRACARDALETYTAAYEQKEIGLALDLAPDLAPECRVYGEASRLDRVLCNLLENALRHSPRGGSVRMRVDDAGASFRVTIEDEGKGVAPELQHLLFQRFGGGGKGGGAVGLGLYFCRSTLDMWGGSIGYEPRPERGSRFWFQLPKAR